MSNQNQERSVRRHRRAIERWLEQRQEAMTQNAIYKDEISASVRQSMLCLARSASLGNPTRAVSSAVSRPEHMCRMLFCVLHNLMEPMFGLNIHFSIRSSGDDLEFLDRNSVLVLRRFAQRPGIHTDPSTLLDNIPLIEIKIGNLQRGSCEINHVCDGLYCTDERHGFTKVICPDEFDLEAYLRNLRVDGRDIQVFSSTALRYCPSNWKHWVRLTDTNNGFPTGKTFEIRYVDNEVSGIVNLVRTLIQWSLLF